MQHTRQHYCYVLIVNVFRRDQVHRSRCRLHLRIILKVNLRKNIDAEQIGQSRLKTRTDRAALSLLRSNYMTRGSKFEILSVRNRRVVLEQASRGIIALVSNNVYCCFQLAYFRKRQRLNGKCSVPACIVLSFGNWRSRQSVTMVTRCGRAALFQYRQRSDCRF